MTSGVDRSAVPMCAVFLDRDGTVARGSAAKAKARDAAVARLLGVASFHLDPAVHEQAFSPLIEDLDQPPVTTVEIEKDFWRRYYVRILRSQGYGGDCEAAAESLCRDFVFWKMLEPYPDAVHVMRTIKSAQLLIGIISDTFPSLELTFREMGLAEYVDSYTSSSVVGVGKPDPRIFRAALDSLGVGSAESVFVDDTFEEVEGARRFGLTSFHIDRRAPADDLAGGVITTLTPLLTLLGIEPRPA